jgi:tetraacyldisaccharide 4'-kinase
LLRGLLGVVEPGYRWAVTRRNREFDSGKRGIQRATVPVISVGNLTLGGTGKTPMVQWLARWFGEHGVKVALVSRGYKSARGAANDEAKELAQKLPSVPHLQNPDRVVAARRAVQEFGAQVILLDDGFQHRRLARDLDIVLIDALEPFGFGHVFPRGTLREPLEGLARANAAVLTRADMVDEAERGRIRAEVERVAPKIVWAQCRHAPQKLIAADGSQDALDKFKGRRVAAFCGIGNPAGFRHTLAQCGYDVVAWREFADHFAYEPLAVQELERWIAAQDIDAVVCTHKDLVKVARKELGNRPLRAVLVGMEFLAGQAEMEKLLGEVMGNNER